MLTKKQIARGVLIYIVILVISFAIGGVRYMFRLGKAAISAKPGKNAEKIINDAKEEGYNVFAITQKDDTCIFVFAKNDDMGNTSKIMCETEKKKKCKISITESIEGKDVVDLNIGGISTDGKLWINYTVNDTVGAFATSYDISGSEGRELETVEGDCWGNATFDEIMTFSEITDSNISYDVGTYFPTERP